MSSAAAGRPRRPVSQLFPPGSDSDQRPVAELLNQGSRSQWLAPIAGGPRPGWAARLLALLVGLELSLIVLDSAVTKQGRDTGRSPMTAEMNPEGHFVQTVHELLCEFKVNTHQIMVINSYKSSQIKILQDTSFQVLVLLSS